MKELKELSDKTLLPLGLAVIVIGGGAIWLTTVYNEVQANTRAIESATITQKEYVKTLQEINLRLTIIEQKIDRRIKF